MTAPRGVHPVLEVFARSRPAELRALDASIASVGIIDPVVVYDGLIVDGRERMDAGERLGIAPPIVVWDGPGDVTDWILARNLARRHYTTSQKAAIAVELIPVFAERAAARRRAGTLPQGCGEVGRAAELAARRVGGVSPRYVEMAKEVAAADPALFVAVKMGEPSLNEAYNKVRVRRVREELRKPLAAPRGRYPTIVVDPAWPENANLPYPAMSIDEILAVEIPAMADAAVFLWTTNRFLPAAFEVLGAWGFEYRQTFVWSKPRAGPGRPFRQQTEYALLGTRGNPTIATFGESNLIEGPVRRHSQKPDEFYDLVERVCPAPRLDMYAREPRDGWVTWGTDGDRLTGRERRRNRTAPAAAGRR